MVCGAAEIIYFPHTSAHLQSVAKQHHRMLGFKSEAAGRSRAKAGVMRRLSMIWTEHESKRPSERRRPYGTTGAPESGDDGRD